MRKLPLLLLLLSTPAEASYSPDKIKTTGATVARTLGDHFTDVINAADYGVSCDGTALADMNITGGTNVLSSQSYAFTSANIGQTIVVTDTNDTVILNTTISGVSSGNALLANNWPNGTLGNNTGRATFYTTDNTSAIAAAIAASSRLDSLGHNTRGFRLSFPNGVCASGHIIQPRLSILSCAGGANACELFEKSGTNADFISSENQAVLTGTGLNYGPNGTYNGRASDNRVPSWFGLENIHLDCNKLGQTSGRCYATYGNMLMLKGTVALDAAHDDCLFTEMSDAPAWSLTDWKSYEEGLVDNLKTRNCGRYGWLDRGPKDKTVGSIVDAESASTGYRSEQSAGLYAGTSDWIGLLHGYAETDHTSAYLGSGANIGLVYPDYANLEIAGSGVSIGHVGTTAGGFGGVDAIIIDTTAYGLTINSGDIEFDPGATNINGLNIKGGQGSYSNFTSSGITPGSGVTAVKLGGAFNTLTGFVLKNISGTGGLCLSLGGSNNIVTATGFSCKTFVDPTPDGGNNMLNFSMYKAAGTNYTSGYGFQGSDFINITKDDGTYIIQSPSGRSSAGALEYTGTAPAIASGSTDCGTSPSIVGNNAVGTITVGTSTNGGKCTITFAGFSYAHPVCSCTDNTQGTVLKGVTTSSTLACTGTITAGDKINYNCAGYY